MRGEHRVHLYQRRRPRNGASMSGRAVKSRGGAMRRVRYPIAVLAVLAGVVTFGIPANAVHDLSFQLDGDVSAATTTNIGGSTQTLDWDSLFDANGNKKALPPGFKASVFTRDFLTNAN